MSVILIPTFMVKNPAIVMDVFGSVTAPLLRLIFSTEPESFTEIPPFVVMTPVAAMSAFGSVTI